jgi:integrase
VQSLEGWKEKADANCPLVFPNSNCSPNGHFLRMCKAVAKRAELPEGEFWLHKFRATFATRALRSGVDLRTVQMWMGHTDLESTMRYLKPNRGKAVRKRSTRCLISGQSCIHLPRDAKRVRVWTMHSLPAVQKHLVLQWEK